MFYTCSMIHDARCDARSAKCEVWVGPDACICTAYTHQHEWHFRSLTAQPLPPLPAPRSPLSETPPRHSTATATPLLSVSPLRTCTHYCYCYCSIFICIYIYIYIYICVCVCICITSTSSYHSLSMFHDVLIFFFTLQDLNSKTPSRIPPSRYSICHLS